MVEEEQGAGCLVDNHSKMLDEDVDSYLKGNNAEERPIEAYRLAGELELHGVGPVSVGDGTTEGVEV